MELARKILRRPAATYPQNLWISLWMEDGRRVATRLGRSCAKTDRQRGPFTSDSGLIIYCINIQTIRTGVSRNADAACRGHVGFRVLPPGAVAPAAAVLQSRAGRIPIAGRGPSGRHP